MDNLLTEDDNALGNLPLQEGDDALVMALDNGVITYMVGCVQHGEDGLQRHDRGQLQQQGQALSVVPIFAHPLPCCVVLCCVHVF